MNGTRWRLLAADKWRRKNPAATGAGIRSALRVCLALLVLADTFSPGRAAAQDAAAQSLPLLESMQVPTAEVLLTGDPVDWIVLTRDEVLVVQPVYPRPDTLQKMDRQRTDLQSVATRPKREPGESDADYRARLDQLRDDSENITVTLPDFVGEAAEYRLGARNVRRIIYHEDLMLQRIDLLLNEGLLEKSFEMLLVLQRRYPDWPGLMERRNRMVFEEAKLRMQRDDLEEALAFFEDLHTQNPQYSGLREGMGETVDRLIRRAADLSDFRQARFYLLRLQKQSPAHPVTQTWTDKFTQQAEDLVNRSRQAREAGQSREALQLALDAVDVWPVLPALRTHFRTVATRYQVLNVGVTRFAGDPTPYFLPTQDDRRHENLLSTRLFEVRQFDRAAYYESAWFEDWMPADLGRRIEFHLRPRRSSWETSPVLTSAQVVRSLQERLLPDSPVYDERLATAIHSMEVRSPFEFVIDFNSVPARPQALFGFPVRDAAPASVDGSAGQPGGILSRRFEIQDRQDDQITFQRVVPQPDGVSQHRVAEIVEKKYPTHVDAVRALLKGDVSVLPHMPIWLADQLEAGGQVFVLPYGVPTTHVLQFNPASQPMRNAELRRVLAFSLDREKILTENILRNPASKRGRLISGPFPTTSYAYRSQIEPRKRDLPSAVALLSISKKQFGGTVPELRMLCEPDETVRAAADRIVQQWARLGITVTLIDDADSTPQNWDIVYRTVRMSEPVADLWPFLTLRQDARVDDLEHLPDWLRQQLIELEQAVDFTTAVELLQGLHFRLHELVHVIPLWEVDDVMVIRNNIQGFPNGMLRPYQNVERWTIQPWYPTDLL